MNTIDPKDLAALADVTIIDVREPGEHEAGHAPGATLIPLGELPQRTGEVPTEGIVYVICEWGGRSAQAVELLVAHGIDAVNVTGGTSAWREAGLPVES